MSGLCTQEPCAPPHMLVILPHHHVVPASFPHRERRPRGRGRCDGSSLLRRFGGARVPGGGLGGGPLPGGSGSSRSARRCYGDEDDTDGPFRLLLVRAEMLHIGEGRPHGRIPCFPHDSGTLPRISVFSGWAPMCRGARSAHGRISTALSVGAFPRDSADPPPAGPGRMCNTARAAPMLHIELGSARPDTAAPPPPPPSRTIAPLPAVSGRRCGAAHDRRPGRRRRP